MTKVSKDRRRFVRVASGLSLIPLPVATACGSSGSPKTASGSTPGSSSDIGRTHTTRELLSWPK